MVRLRVVVAGRAHRLSMVVLYCKNRSFRWKHGDGRVVVVLLEDVPGVGFDATANWAQSAVNPPDIMAMEAE